MKIRTDFVTNSSSTSFGASVVNSGVASLITIFVAMGWTEEEAYERLKQMGQPYKENKSTASSKSSADSDNSGLFSPEDVVSSDLPLSEKIKQLDDEINKYEKQWEELKTSLDEKDVEKARQEYSEYVEYVESMKAEAEYVEFEKELQKAVVEAAQDAKNQWVESQKQDFVNTKEQISVLKAHIDGYGSAGYDVTEAKRQLDDCLRREKELKATLEKEKIDFDYTAKERAPIGPSVVISEKMKEIEDDLQKALAEIEREKVLAKKREIMERTQAEYQKIADAYTKEANTHDKLLTAAETIVAGADMAIEILSLLTGKPGELIKTGYKAVKNIATGASEAYVDPENAAKHIGTGILKGAGDIVKDNISPGAKSKVIDKFNRLGIKLTPDQATKVIQQGVTVVVDTGSGAIQGLGTPDGALLGAIKGAGKGITDVVLDVPGNIGLDKLPESGLGKLAKGAGSFALDQTKNYAKGESVIYTDWQRK